MGKKKSKMKGASFIGGILDEGIPVTQGSPPEQPAGAPPPAKPKKHRYPIGETVQTRHDVYYPGFVGDLRVIRHDSDGTYDVRSYATGAIGEFKEHHLRPVPKSKPLRGTGKPRFKIGERVHLRYTVPPLKGFEGILKVIRYPGPDPDAPGPATDRLVAVETEDTGLGRIFREADLTHVMETKDNPDMTDHHTRKFHPGDHVYLTPAASLNAAYIDIAGVPLEVIKYFNFANSGVVVVKSTLDPGRQESFFERDLMPIADPDDEHTIAASRPITPDVEKNSEPTIVLPTEGMSVYCRYCGRLVNDCHANPCLARTAHLARGDSESSVDVRPGDDPHTVPMLRVPKEQAPTFYPVATELWLCLYNKGGVAAHLLVLGYRTRSEDGNLDILVAGTRGPEWVTPADWDEAKFYPQKPVTVNVEGSKLDINEPEN